MSSHTLQEFADNGALEPVDEIVPFKGRLNGVVLLDLSWCMYRGHYAFPQFSVERNGEEVKTGAIFGPLVDVMEWSARHPDYALILCADWGTFRRKINADYKGQREERSKSDVKQHLRNVLQTASLAPHVYVAAAPDLEADDHIFNLSQRFGAADFHVVIYGSDKDLHQCITTSTIAMTNTSRADAPRTGLADIPEEWGVPPQRIAMARAFSGDSSDNLRGYKRFPTKLAKALAKGFPTPRALLSSPDEKVFDVIAKYDGKVTAPKRKWIEKVRAAPSTLISNYAIMKLSTVGALYLHRALPEPLLIEALKLNSYGLWLLSHGIDWRMYQ